MQALMEWYAGLSDGHLVALIIIILIVLSWVHGMFHSYVAAKYGVKEEEEDE